MVVMEFCRFGNLHDYLSKHRKSFVSQIDQSGNMLVDVVGLDETEEDGGLHFIVEKYMTFISNV